VASELRRICAVFIETYPDGEIPVEGAISISAETVTPLGVIGVLSAGQSR